MTSIKFHFRPSEKNGARDGKLFIRIIHRRRSRTIPTLYNVYENEWDKERQTVILPRNDRQRKSYLEGIMMKIAEDKDRLGSSLRALSALGEYDVEDVVRFFKTGIEDDQLTIAGYCDKVCTALVEEGRERTARAYRSAVRSLQSFLPDRVLTLADMTAAVMKAYEAHLLGKGLYLNTVSFYMRQLRAIYYRAARENIVRRRLENPFSDVFTGVRQSRRRAISEDELNSLASLETVIDRRVAKLRRAGEVQDMKHYIKLKRSLLLFLFCFHARCMSFVDMAYLKKSDVGRDTIVYKRRKTGRFLEVGITAPMREIMDCFAGNGASPYVFGIIDPSRGHERTQYESGLRKQNQLLALLSQMAGLDKKVTTHVSRHTWATVAKRHEVSVAVISEALGHRDAKTTEHYLASFDQSVLDKLSMEMSDVIKKKRKAA